VKKKYNLQDNGPPAKVEIKDKDVICKELVHRSIQSQNYRAISFLYAAPAAPSPLNSLFKRIKVITVQRLGPFFF
jgi:hypothetical protein